MSIAIGYNNAATELSTAHENEGRSDKRGTW